ncbi:hypothetical protein Lrub_1727 [Legionella rubrilucens]|uniref:UPF0235 protein Lrub_1727 n=2 Tax=Legionella rubrilucens TaxID=458 RepID=A0A0W0XQC9_9GAMM|nr:hypothetical protein Lrub_1727 [Legionella rubrilucens]
MQLTLKVKPASRVNALLLNNNQGLLLELKASPQEGKANQALVVYLARLLGLTQKQVMIGSGHHARDKKIRLLVEEAQQKQMIQGLDKVLKII